jgi:PAS domain S-box-containing protein
MMLRAAKHAITGVGRGRVSTKATRATVLGIVGIVTLLSFANNLFAPTDPQLVFRLNILLLLVAALNFSMAVAVWRIDRVNSDLLAGMALILIVSLTIAIGFSSGFDSGWFVFYYPLVLLFSLVAPPRTSLALTAAIATAYGSVSFFDGEWAVLVARLGVLLLIGLFASLLGDRQRLARSEAQVRRNEAAQRRLANDNAALAEIGRIITSSLDINEVYARFVEQLRKLIPSDRTTITLLDDKLEILTNEYVLGGEVSGRGQGSSFPVAGSLTQVVMREQSGVLVPIEDEEQMEETSPELLPFYRAGYRALLSAPLIYQDKLVGVLHLWSRCSTAFEVQDLQLAERVGAQIAGAIANAQLYSERVDTGWQLAESEVRFRELIENAGDAFFLHDVKGRIIDANDRACDSLGYTREELLALRMRDIEQKFNDLDISRIFEKIRVGSPVTRDGVHLRKDGSEFPVEVRLGKFHWRGHLLCIALARDITERMHLEQQLLQAQKMEAVGQLAGGIAHDFNNLLTVITSYSDLGMAKLAPDDRVTAYLQQIQKASERATQLTRQLLAFSRRQTIEPRAVNFNDLILGLDGMLRRIISEDIELVTLPAPDLGLAKVDPGQTEQVLANLVVNARDAMPQGGRIVIETANVTLDETHVRQHLDATDGDHVMVAVTDDGEGMTPEVKTRIFEPFFTTKEVDKGTGLGLSTCYGIVADSGGTLWWKANPVRVPHSGCISRESASRRRSPPSRALQASCRSVVRPCS